MCLAMKIGLVHLKAGVASITFSLKTLAGETWEELQFNAARPSKSKMKMLTTCCRIRVRINCCRTGLDGGIATTINMACRIASQSIMNISRSGQIATEA